MGYACPVCETPQSDAEHLANHLAFTAMLGDDDHEAWLDEHAPGWNEEGEGELADRVTEHAEEAEFPQVFEDTTPNRDHRHDDGPRGGDLFEDELERANTRGRGSMAGGAGGAGGAGALDGEAQRILQEAQEMTEELLDDEGEDGDEGGNGSGSEDEVERDDEDERE